MCENMYIISSIMVLYGGPGKERLDYRSKFIRVEDEIFVTKPGDMDTTHIELAVKDGIESRIDDLRNQNPVEVDAGTMNVSPSKKRISVGVDSMSLDLPVEKASKKARKRSVEVLLEQSKGYSVGSF